LDRGLVRVLGLDPTSQPLDLRQRVGYMPENDCFVDKLDAASTCEYAAQLCGLPRAEAQQRAHSVLDYVGLGDKRYMKVQAYSTGQKQRVKLAQALVHDPDLLLLDEPTNGLDPRGRDEMLALIGQLPRRRGCSIILSSHLLPDVEAVCDRVCVLAEGQLLHDGTIADLKREDRDYYAVRTKTDPQRLAERLARAGCQAELHDGALRVRLPPGGDTSVVFREALAAGVQIRHLQHCELGLEEAFLDVLRRGTLVAEDPTGAPR
jgi:ABC-2 type transport system ATP-binding protein